MNTFYEYECILMNTFMNILLLNIFDKCEYITSILRLFSLSKAKGHRFSLLMNIFMKHIHEECGSKLNHPENMVNRD